MKRDFTGFAVGVNDFKKLLDEKGFYVDKTLFIKELLDDNSDVLLMPRPRRFGKSMNMSMLDYYFNMEYKSKNLFKELNINKCDKKYTDEMNKYPVINITLKNLKKTSYEEFINKVKSYASSVYFKFNYLLESKKIDNASKEYFKRILNLEETLDLSSFLANLIQMLYMHYEKE